MSEQSSTVIQRKKEAQDTNKHRFLLPSLPRILAFIKRTTYSQRSSAHTLQASKRGVEVRELTR